MNSTQTSIIQTLLYASLFHSPLTANEIYTKLISSRKITRKTFDINLSLLLSSGEVVKKSQFYSLKKHNFSSRKRLQQIKLSRRKFKILQQNLRKIINLPFIHSIYLTGSLSLLSSSQKDDFDLLIITEKNRLWFVRFLLIIKTEFLKLRRHPKDKSFKNKFCFNLFLEKNNLEMSKKMQNLFLAHEIIHARPLFSTSPKNILLEKNKWVLKFLPHSFLNSQNQFHLVQKNGFNFYPKFTILSKSKSKKNLLLDFLNIILYKLQYIYMKPKIGNETIKKSQTFFHPQNLSPRILSQFELEKKQIS